MDLWYFVLFSVTSVQLSSASDQLSTSGTVLNERWVLSLARPLKSKNATDLAIMGGKEVYTDPRRDKNKISIQESVVQSGPKRPEYAMILLQTAEEIVFSESIQPVIGNLNPQYCKCVYLHCELVAWYLAADTWVKSRIFVVPETNSTNCTITSDVEFCVDPLLESEVEINPCAAKVNLGIPLMCDVSIEGVFLGMGPNGCDNPAADANNKVYLFEKDSVDKFLYGTQKLKRSE
ncbi:uncharacterized protein LOC123014769 isoform X2 [Tribolium madens]|uniref:uncharacterized protein LOC123014769 isoform X2 n=1 Tax=Tribolium madens TaxID=41895 RepID=UPI001CF7341E|nr:uncharacterized protein LOC123014769 isoform X2 [Tribolium madens]